MKHNNVDDTGSTAVLDRPKGKAGSGKSDAEQQEMQKKMEAAGAFSSKILQATDVADPESFKVRRGKVGGYPDYLVGDDLVYANEAMRRLEPRFGYNT
jgi:hypothetical protein